MTLHSLFRRRAVRSALATSLLALSSSAPGCARDTGPITIGVIGPLTDPLGIAERRAAQLAVAQINARGGVRGGRRLALRIVDDSGSENGAVLGARVLYDDPDVQLGRRPLLEVWVRRAAYGCDDQHEPSHAVRVGQREVDRSLTTHRARDDNRLLEASKTLKRTDWLRLVRESVRSRA